MTRFSDAAGGTDLDQAAFRNAMGLLVTGVAVITARDPGTGEPRGMTANALMSVSLTPPGYNSFSAWASSGFANAARYAAASDFACCTPFQSSRASSPFQGSFICAASHGGGSTACSVSRIPWPV